MKKLFCFCFVCWVLTIGLAQAKNTKPVHLYLDADLSVAKASATSIEQGIRTALAEVGNRLDGRPVEFIALNHRGNSARSLANINKVLADPEALAMYGGLHSPPLLVHKDIINERGLLTLVPWAAAGPITRASQGENWIFRLSVDDTKAGEIMVTRAVDVRRFKKPALLLEQTGWGKSNFKNMSASLEKRGLVPANVSWFNWGTRTVGAKIVLREIFKSGADVILMVANAAEGKIFCNAMLEFPEKERLPIISHWGITGGDFPQVITVDMRQDLDLEFIQTGFSFLAPNQSAYATQVFARASRLFPELKSPVDLKAPTGFIHAYDLTKLLIAAVNKVGLQASMKENRANVRRALENIDMQVPGLVKTYFRPFRPYTSVDTDAHEALGAEDIVFGVYGDMNEIRLVP